MKMNIDKEFDRMVVDFAEMKSSELKDISENKKGIWAEKAQKAATKALELKQKTHRIIG